MPIFNSVFKSFEQGWKPGANTVAYYPLDTDFNDASGNSRNLTNTNATITTLNGISCAYYNGSSYSQYSGYSLTRDARTISLLANGVSLYDDVLVDIKKYNAANSGALGISFYRDTIGAADFSGNGTSPVFTGSTNTRYYIVVTQEGDTVKTYINGSLIGTSTSRPTYSNAPDGWMLGSQNNSAHNGKLNGYLSRVILEDKGRTEKEVLNDFNSINSIYGIS